MIFDSPFNTGITISNCISEEEIEIMIDDMVNDNEEEIEGYLDLKQKKNESK